MIALVYLALLLPIAIAAIAGYRAADKKQVAAHKAALKHYNDNAYPDDSWPRSAH